MLPGRREESLLGIHWTLPVSEQPTVVSMQVSMPMCQNAWLAARSRAPRAREHSRSVSPDGAPQRDGIRGWMRPGLQTAASPAGVRRGSRGARPATGSGRARSPAPSRCPGPGWGARGAGGPAVRGARRARVRGAGVGARV